MSFTWKPGVNTPSVKDVENTLIGLSMMVDSLKQQLAESQRDLAECYRLTGADPDGNEDWRLAPCAVTEVRRMRGELDAANDALAEATRQLEDAERRLP